MTAFDTLKRSGTRVIHRRPDFGEMFFDKYPVWDGENYDCDRPAIEVLLIREILVAGYEYLERCFLGSSNQVTILKAGPSR
jgi:hypothetical protein